ncbi:MarR family winged helix-turn-helix transcriptional regulator [Nocardia niwae]|uniref:MarR family transcriptional regulator n=1 Tax=Nocardia niwae TaxID=626084 RepID=A0ABV2X9F6_9NOCA
MDVHKLFDDPRLTTMGLFFEAYGGVVAKLEPVWKAHGLSGLDVNALMRLSRSPGRRLRMTELAAQTELSTSGVTRLIDRLARSELVVRELDPGDRRGAFAVLTEAGAARLAQVLPDYLAAVDRWFVGLLTPEQLAALSEALRIIRDKSNPEATFRMD